MEVLAGKPDFIVEVVRLRSLLLLKKRHLILVSPARVKLQVYFRLLASVLELSASHGT